MSARHPAHAGARAPRIPSLWWQYYQSTPRPLYCLLFLFPLAATYEFGALLLRPASSPQRQLVAHSLIQKLLGWFGASGVWLPALALIATLLIWHSLRGHAWRIRGWVLPLMAVESMLLTMPLFVLGQVVLRAGTAPGAADLRQQVVLALGAGVYEELVFRLYLVGGLQWLLERLARIPSRFGHPLVILLSAAVFALCHFVPIGSAPLVWQHFVLLMLAGAYLALVYLGRGLGVAAGCHTAYNLLPLLWPWPAL